MYFDSVSQRGTGYEFYEHFRSFETHFFFKNPEQQWQCVHDKFFSFLTPELQLLLVKRFSNQFQKYIESLYQV